MKHQFKKLRVKQLERAIEPFLAARDSPRPQRGWIHAIREATGIPLRQLSRKLRKSLSLVIYLEKSEADYRIKLGSLRDAADALGCQLVYALVPKSGSIQDLAEERSRTKAAENVRAVEHSMALEDQAVGKVGRKNRRRNATDAGARQTQVTTLTTGGDGTTPLSPEELADLIPNLATKDELNEWERENILLAREWAVSDRTTPLEMVSDQYIRKLNEKMFDETWKWAGQYRLTEKNIGVAVHQIRERLVALFEDVRYWIENKTYGPDEIAVRFHHRLVLIHPFPNGNGRHARLIADVIVMKLGSAAFTWGSANFVEEGSARAKYLEAIRAADNGDIQPLLLFARS